MAKISERHHDADALPVLEPTAKLEISVVVKRLNELGIKPKSKDPKQIREQLDAAVKEAFEVKADALSQDPTDCFGKTAIYDSTAQACKKCSAYKACGKYVIDALKRQEGLLSEAEEEAVAEEEAENVMKEALPKLKKATIRQSTVSDETFLRADGLKAWREDIQIIYGSTKPKEDPEMPGLVSMIWKMKPTTAPDFRKVVALGYFKSKKSEATETALDMLVVGVDSGWFKVKVV